LGYPLPSAPDFVDQFRHASLQPVSESKLRPTIE
jgi:hypothetical protein